MQPELSRSSKRHRSRSPDTACSSRVVGLADVTLTPSHAAMGCDLERGAMISTQSHTHARLVALHRLRRSRRSAQIRHFVLRRSHNITDMGLVSVAILQQLRRLELMYCSCISDAGLASIARLQHLQYIDFRWSGKITDAGLRSITPLQCLQHLVLNGYSRSQMHAFRVLPHSSIFNTLTSDAASVSRMRS